MTPFQRAIDLWRAGRRDQAAAALKRLLPDPVATRALASLLMEQGLADQALFHARRLVGAAPADASAQGLLGRLLHEAGVHKEAEAAYRLGLAARPFDPDLTAALAGVLAECGRAEEALGLLRAAAARHPKAPALLSVTAFMLNYVDAPAAERLAAHTAFGDLMPRDGHPAFSNTPDPERRLRVAYLSADLREHSVIYYIESLLHHHDRSAFDVTCHHIGGREDAASTRLKGLSDRWVHTFPADGLRIREAIAADAPDVIVELGGHTCPPALAALGRRLAPLQITYLGYPDTTGMRTFDARLVDAVTDPPGAERWATEPLVRLPGCFLCYTPPPTDVAPPPRRAPRNAPTFGSFNNPAKLSSRTISLWSRVLTRVPGSQLMLKGKSLAAAKAVVLDQFAREGIDPGRIICLSATRGLREHFEAYSGISVALDPAPYNGTTTTCEALWMGVPVVTLAGDHHAGRVGASLLTAAGLDELIARSPENYIDLAAKLIADGPRPAELRAALRQQVAVSALCDGAAHTRHLETAYRSLWRAWCERQRS